MPVAIRPRYEFEPWGFGVEWPPVAPVRDDFTQYEINNFTNILNIPPSSGLDTGPFVLSPAHYQGMAMETQAAAFGIGGGGATWPAANKAHYSHLVVLEPITIKTAFVQNDTP